MSATAMFFDALNVVESAIFTVPPENFLAGTLDRAKVNGSEVPWGLEGGILLVGGGSKEI